MIKTPQLAVLVLLAATNLHSQIPVLVEKGDVEKAKLFSKLLQEYQSARTLLEAPQHENTTNYAEQLGRKDEDYLSELFNGTWKASRMGLATDHDSLILHFQQQPLTEIENADFIDRPDKNLLLFEISASRSHEAGAVVTILQELLKASSPPNPQSFSITVNPSSSSEYILVGSVRVNPGWASAVGLELGFLAVRETGNAVNVIFQLGRNLIPNLYEPWMVVSANRFPPIQQRLKSSSNEEVLELLRKPGKERPFAIAEAVDRGLPGAEIATAAGIQPHEGGQPHAYRSLGGDPTAKLLKLFLAAIRKTPPSRQKEYAAFLSQFFEKLAADPKPNRELLTAMLVGATDIRDLNLSDSALQLLQRNQLGQECLLYLETKMDTEQQIVSLQRIAVGHQFAGLKNVALLQAKKRVGKASEK